MKSQPTIESVSEVSLELDFDEIRLQAFLIYEERQKNSVDGSPEQDWYQAVQTLTERTKRL